jgi:hypothetical protein
MVVQIVRVGLWKQPRLSGDESGDLCVRHRLVFGGVQRCTTGAFTLDYILIFVSDTDAAP